MQATGGPKCVCLVGRTSTKLRGCGSWHVITLFCVQEMMFNQYAVEPMLTAIRSNEFNR